jgi:FkbM family methyltransferase
MNKIKLAFDIGANIGKTSDILKTVSDKVICFEANPGLISNLRKKFNNSNVTVDCRGISNKIGQQVFHICPTSAISTLSEDWINTSRFANTTMWNDKIEIDTTTLDNIIDEYGIPDYVKIDIEGHEHEALTSLTKVLNNTIFSFEWVEEHKSKIDDILKHLYKLGYNRFGVTEGDELLFDEQINWVSCEEFNLISSLDEKRKTRWGMIYFKINNT